MQENNKHYKMVEQRTDGRYPLRVGCTGDFLMFDVGFPILFGYTKDANGDKKDGMLKTSTVTRIVRKKAARKVTYAQ